MAAMGDRAANKTLFEAFAEADTAMVGGRRPEPVFGGRASS
jgi:hypothetical protein